MTNKLLDPEYHSKEFRKFFNKLLMVYRVSREEFSNKSNYAISYVKKITTKDKLVSDNFVLNVHETLKLSTPHFRMLKKAANKKNQEIVKRKL